jgi:NAD(P)-dependent dehydrogenase (short-subunit alcohol dehydrogenase family)
VANDQMSDKIVVITGGASGIGRACARRFADEGARVVLSDKIASTALFLSTDQSSYTTGQILHPAGGMYTG